MEATYEPTAGRQPGSLPFFRTWQYDACGNSLRATGPAAEWNPFTFSTKYLDKETGWSYYGYRYYDALRGRWPSKDPIGERGG